NSSAHPHRGIFSRTGQCGVTEVEVRSDQRRGRAENRSREGERMVKAAKSPASRVSVRLSLPVPHRPTVGLALGSGSARGWAHIGVIQSLREAGVQIDYVAGASMGAVVGAAFCAGQLDVLVEEALLLDWRRLASMLDLTLPRSGLLVGM